MAGMDEPGSERRVEARKSPRLNRILAAELQIVPGADPEPLNLFLVDLSLSGMRINTDRELPDDSPFYLRIPLEGLGQTLPGDLALACRVAWKKGLVGGTWVHGLEFLQDDLQARPTIEDLLRSCTSETGRRRFRLNRLLPISLQLDPEGPWKELYASDLSTGGMCAQLGQKLERHHPVSVRVHLEFDLPTVELQARVAWTGEQPHGRVETGLEFLDVDEYVSLTIDRYIDRCLSLR